MRLCQALEMSVCRYTFVWLFLFTLYSTSADVTKRCSWLDNPKNSVGCGRNLAKTLSFVCDGQYNDGVTRSVSNSIHTDDSAFLKKPSAFSYLHGLTQWPKDQGPNVWRVTRSGNMWKGVVCECCYNMCSLPEMCHYCMDVQNCKSNFGK